MVEQIVQVSEAVRQSVGRMRLMPALMMCPECKTTRQIASPEIATCTDCGSAMQVMRQDEQGA